MAANLLFNDRDLAGALGYPVDANRAATVERVVWGRAMPILDLTERPADLGDDVFAIVFQLGILFYENPGLWAKTTTGSDSTDFTTVAQMDALFTELRELAASKGGTAPTEAGVASPRARFPLAEPYPDRASVTGWSRGGRSW